MESRLCECGCGGKLYEGPRGWKRFIHGHHAKGRRKSDDEKRRIGEANSKNMRRFYAEHPDKAREHVARMNAVILQPDRIKKRIQATRQAYASMTAADKQKFSDNARKLWGSGIMKAAHQKASATFRERSAGGQYDFTERNQKLSEAISRKYVDGSWKFAKGSYLSTKTGKQFYFRSSWERLLMEQLDADPEVTVWEAEFMSLPYEFDGAIHRYVPDFHVVRGDKHQLIEVKPSTLCETSRNQAKRVAAQQHCLERGWEYIEWEP